MNNSSHIQVPTLYHNARTVHLHIIVMNLVKGLRAIPKAIGNQSGLPVSEINHRCWRLSHWKPTAGNCLGTLVHVRQLGQGSDKRLVFVQNLPVQDVLLGRVSFSGDHCWAVLGNAQMSRVYFSFFIFFHFFLPDRTGLRRCATAWNLKSVLSVFLEIQKALTVGCYSMPCRESLAKWDIFFSQHPWKCLIVRHASHQSCQ